MYQLISSFTLMFSFYLIDENEIHFGEGLATYSDIFSPNTSLSSHFCDHAGMTIGAF